MKSVRIRVPASCGNVGSGFDVLGAALELYNELEVTRTAGSSIDITVEGEGAGELAHAGNLAVKTLKGLGGLKIRMVNRIPLGRGLGSSGCARLAAHAAALLLKGEDWRRCLELASKDEGHPDNAAASFHGGVVASRWQGDKVAAFKFKVPAGLSTVVAIPDFQLSTEKARRALPKKVPMEDAVFNLGRVAFLIAGLAQGKTEGLGEAIEDRLHQPYRRKLIPGFDKVRAAAIRAGALGSCLSGAGPTMFALLDKKADPERVGRAMVKAFASAGVRSRALPLPFENCGLCI